MIYADNAATTALSPAAFEAMKPFLLEHYGNASQPYSFARPAKKALRAAREQIAACIGALPEEIYFTSGGTESDNWAIRGTLPAGGDRRAVITSEFEHHAVLHTCAAIERQGYPVTYLHPTKDGFITPEILQKALTDRTGLVSIMLVNNEIGTVQPVRELCAAAHAHGALFHTDAVQAVGHLDLHVTGAGVDLLSASAHKFNGPKGTGFLYIRKGTDIRPYAAGGAQEAGLRAGTENIAGIAGMAAALQENVALLAETRQHLQHLEQVILERLDAAGIDYIRNGGEPHIPGSLSLAFRGCGGEMLLHRLDLMGIMVSTGSACSSVRTELSHVLRAIEADANYAAGTIRISLGKDNTEEEARRIAEALIRIIRQRTEGA